MRDKRCLIRTIELVPRDWERLTGSPPEPRWRSDLPTAMQLRASGMRLTLIFRVWASCVHYDAIGLHATKHSSPLSQTLSISIRGQLSQQVGPLLQFCGIWIGKRAVCCLKNVFLLLYFLWRSFEYTTCIYSWKEADNKRYVSYLAIWEIISWFHKWKQVKF